MNETTQITIAQYIKTRNGKALRKLFDKYRNRKTIKTLDALEYLCVSEVYFCLFEGSIRPDDFYLPPKFDEIPPKDIVDGLKAWATEDGAADILSCTQDDRRYSEFTHALYSIAEEWFKEDEEDEEKEDESVDPYNPKPHRINIHDIDWDTSDWDSDLADPCNANVPDLPEEIEDVEVEWDEDEDPDEAIGDWLSDTYGFCVNSFSWDCDWGEDGNPEYHDEFGEKVEK